MQKIGLKCVGENLVFTNIPDIFSGDIDSVGLAVEFDTAWDGYGRTAVFYDTAGEPSFKVLDHNNECIVSREVLAKDGRIFIGVIGSDGTRVITSQLVKLKIGKGATTLSGEPEPTPDVWEQILVNYGEAMTAINGFSKDITGFSKDIADFSKKLPFGFGIDDNGRYGYQKYGESKITPFSSGESESSEDIDELYTRTTHLQKEISSVAVFSDLGSGTNDYDNEGYFGAYPVIGIRIPVIGKIPFRKISIKTRLSSSALMEESLATISILESDLSTVIASKKFTMRNIDMAEYEIVFDKDIDITTDIGYIEVICDQEFDVNGIGSLENLNTDISPVSDSEPVYYKDTTITGFTDWNVASMDSVISEYYLPFKLYVKDITDKRIRNIESKLPFRLGIDENGNYGYYKDGETNLTPFGSGGSKENGFFEYGIGTLNYEVEE